MWTTQQILNEVVGGRVGERYEPVDGVADMPRDELLDAVRQELIRPRLLERPQVARDMSRALLAAEWTLLLEHLQFPSGPRVLEPCAGGGEPVVMALDVLFGAGADYTTVNLNRHLAAELLDRTNHLDIEVKVIEDDACNLSAYFGESSLDCACFHHATNDILQTAVAGRHGMDTRDVDWWPTEQTMIEWLGEQHRADGLASVGLPELRTIILSAARAVRPGGYICFDHWTSEYHLGLDWFPGELFNELIPMTRDVALSLPVNLEEITPPGLDRQWWMVLRRP